MADKNPLTPEEVTELFSEIDASGVLDPTLAKKRTERMREKEAAAKRGDKAALAQLRSEDRASQAKHIDPLSEDDPSGSQVSHTITKTAMAVVIGILVLIVGMRANDENAALAEGAGLRRAPSGFFAPRDLFLNNVCSDVDGIFYAGTVTAPKTIGETLNEAVAAADAAAQYLGA